MNGTRTETVLFLDGTVARLPILFYRGACLVGQPTAGVIWHGKFVWVVPGQSASWVEAIE